MNSSTLDSGAMQNPNIVISRRGHNHGKKRLLPVLMLNRGVECRLPEGIGCCQERVEFATALCEWELLAKKGIIVPSSIRLECIFAKKGFPRTLRLRQIQSSQDSKRPSQWHALAQAVGDLKIRIKEGSLQKNNSRRSCFRLFWST